MKTVIVTDDRLVIIEEADEDDYDYLIEKYGKTELNDEEMEELVKLRQAWDNAVCDAMEFENRMFKKYRRG
jgi:hypothetical protein